MTRRDRASKKQQQPSSSKQTTLPPSRPFLTEADPLETVIAPKTDISTTSFNLSQIGVDGTTAASYPATDFAPIQTKLTIGEPGDKYEQEADNVAKAVVQQINSPQAQREDEIQRSSSTISSMTSSIQRQGSISAGTASNEFENNLNSARGGGSTLEPTIKGQMESAMGVDFSGVKIHTGHQADQLSRSIQAKAFTTGQDVFFKQGEYSPNSRNGQELLAHELTHVVQQNGSVSRQIESAPQTTIQRYTVEEDDTMGQLQVSKKSKFIKPVGTERELWAQGGDIDIAKVHTEHNDMGILTVERGEEKQISDKTYYKVKVLNKVNEQDQTDQSSTSSNEPTESPKDAFDDWVEWLDAHDDSTTAGTLMKNYGERRNPFTRGSYIHGAWASINANVGLKIAKLTTQGPNDLVPIGDLCRYLINWQSRIKNVNSEEAHEFTFMVADCGGFSRMVMPGQETTEDQAIVGSRMMISKNFKNLPGPWQNHYAAVLMTDDSDKVSLETAAGMTEWWFGMYGNESPEQTFYAKTLLKKLEIGDSETDPEVSNACAVYFESWLAGDQATANKQLPLMEEYKEKLDEALEKLGITIPKYDDPEFVGTSKVEYVE